MGCFGYIYKFKLVASSLVVLLALFWGIFHQKWLSYTFKGSLYDVNGDIEAKKYVTISTTVIETVTTRALTTEMSTKKSFSIVIETIPLIETETLTFYRTVRARESPIIGSVGGQRKDYFKGLEARDKCFFDWPDVYAEPDTYGLEHCSSKQDVLYAMTSGGSIGNYLPYLARNCSHLMYTLDGFCHVWQKFRNIIFVGDSVSKTHHSAMMILLRRDLRFGSLYQSNMTSSEGLNCECREQFKPECMANFAINSVSEFKNLQNGENNSFLTGDCANVEISYLPILGSDTSNSDFLYASRKLEQLCSSDPTDRRPVAVILQHGDSSSHDSGKSYLWFKKLMQPFADKFSNDVAWLWMPPGNAGYGILQKYRYTDAHFRLRRFQLEMEQLIKSDFPEIDQIQTFNSTLRVRSFDGVHSDYEENILRSIMVTNWLDFWYNESMPLIPFNE